MSTGTDGHEREHCSADCAWYRPLSDERGYCGIHKMTGKRAVKGYRAVQVVFPVSTCPYPAARIWQLRLL